MNDSSGPVGVLEYAFMYKNILDPWFKAYKPCILLKLHKKCNKKRCATVIYFYKQLIQKTYEVIS